MPMVPDPPRERRRRDQQRENESGMAEDECAEPARAQEQHLRFEELPLAHTPDLRHDDMPAVAVELGRGEGLDRSGHLLLLNLRIAKLLFVRRLGLS